MFDALAIGRYGRIFGTLDYFLLLRDPNVAVNVAASCYIAHIFVIVASLFLCTSATSYITDAYQRCTWRKSLNLTTASTGSMTTDRHIMHQT